MSATNRVLPRKSSPPRDRTVLRRKINKTLMLVLLIAPGMILFLTFVLVPVIQSARYSVYDWNGFGQPEDYVGLDNYRRLYEHTVFRTALSNSFKIMFLSLVVQLPIAMLLALLVARGSLPGRRFFRALLFIPYVFSEVIVAIIWWYVFHPNDGLATTIFTTFGLTPIEWLGDKDVVIYSIFLVLTWKYFGYYMILYMAGLQGVPQDLEDAMSRQAQAERERQSRIILGESEKQIASSFAEASAAYVDNPTALHLRAMNMLFEGLKQKGALVIVPSSAVDTMNLGAVGGIASLASNTDMMGQE